MANVSPLRPYMLFTDKNGNLTKEAYDFLFGVFQRIGGSLDNLNAATLETFTWEEPGQIGQTTPNTGKFTTLTADSLDVASLSSSTGIKSMRVTSGSIAAGATSSLTCFWVSPFADANYTVIAGVVNTAHFSVQITSYAADKVVVDITNNSGAAATTELHFIGMHD